MFRPELIGAVALSRLDFPKFRTIMKYLGIDFGLNNLGLSYAEGPLSEPFSQYHYTSQKKALEFLKHVIKKEQINTIVIGLPEGRLAKKVKDFGSQLYQQTNLPVFYQDETLSTREAKQKMLEAHFPQKKRRQDHRIAATIILQSYLDDHYKS